MADLKISFEITNQPVSELENSRLLFNSQLVSHVHADGNELKFLQISVEKPVLTIPLLIKKGIQGKQLIMPQFVPYFSFTPTFPLDSTTQIPGSIEQKIITVLAEALDSLKCAYIELNFLPVFWLPLHWAGYTITPRITYRLDTAPDKDILFSNLRNNIQRHIKKSEQLHKIEESTNARLLFELNKESFQRKKDRHPYSLSILENLCKYLFDKNLGRILIASNKQGKTIAAALFGMDAQHVYYLTGGVLTENKSEGAMSRLLWEGILWAKSQNRQFDFEGSMNKNIAAFFASFGAVPFTYYQLSKSNSKVYKLYKTLKS